MKWSTWRCSTGRQRARSQARPRRPLTHGFWLNSSGKLCNFVHYGVSLRYRAHRYDEMSVALENKPKLIVAGASAYCLSGISPPARLPTASVRLMDMAHIAGLVARNCIPTRCPTAMW